MEQLLEIMERLRDPETGCPWDREQTFRSIAPYTIEEAYEVADSIERGELDELREELGDLLFQVVFYAQMAKEQGHFDFHGIVAAISEKMLRRHPHVFGGEKIADAAEQSTAWERHKSAERRAKSAQSPSQLDGVAQALPALVRAEKLQKRASRVGFDWPSVEGVAAKVKEELAELEAERRQSSDHRRLLEEVGDLLFSCVNLARHLEVDAEAALRDSNSKFERRFRAVEAGLSGQGKSVATASLEEMDGMWDEIKRSEQETGDA
jgi:MazG family protein